MPKQIMIVEDNDEIREMLEFLLQSEKYTVCSFADAAGFRAQISKVRPDALIFDVSLPDGNGLDLCKELRSDPATVHLPVIIMSASGDLSAMSRACQADDFIKKPFDIYDFICRVKKQMVG
ncbi:response regulator [Pedobacter yonginense]|uniref:Response regulator n=1 Tax=Pedobacter yonginense TaxID=651869 RepID=A0A317EIG2_9SPHI|nr:response regulator transcription factor [Pedobacter yonginense]PWS26620.1 response regulator [Pedobacter yonginense]